MIGEVEVSGELIPYRKFIFAGILAQTLFFQSFFEAAYGSFVRMYYQKVFQAIAMTPITLSEVLWAEILWDSSKATFASSAVLVLGVIIGDFSVFGAIVSLPIVFLCSMIFSSLGLLVAGICKTIDDIGYPQYLLIFPMFLFCAVFFPLSQLPEAMQIAAWFLPLTAVVSLLRTLTIGTDLDPQVLVLLPAWWVLLVFWSRRAMTKRLVK